MKGPRRFLRAVCRAEGTEEEAFSDFTNNQTGTFQNIQHSVTTGEALPSRLPPYRIAPPYKIQQEIETLLKAGTIFLHGHMVSVRKPDGSVRICIDFRKLNNITVTDPYIMALIDKTFEFSRMPFGLRITPVYISLISIYRCCGHIQQ